MNVLFTSGIRIEQHLGNGVISFGKEDIGLLRSDNSFRYVECKNTDWLIRTSHNNIPADFSIHQSLLKHSLRKSRDLPFKMCKAKPATLVHKTNHFDLVMP